MKFYKKVFCRVYQAAVRTAMVFMPWRQPELITGEGCFRSLPQKVGKGFPLVICDKSGVARGVTKGLENYPLYDGVLPNPTVAQVEEAVKLYEKNGCDCIVAVGGGSVMDCAKAVGARVARPDKSVNQLRGLLKVRKAIPTLYAVPTTAGTGSECTVAAVITDSEKQDKYAINDFALIPRYAVLDPLLTVGLPAHLTASTGMDALTHAVEAYVGRSNTSATKKQAEEATRLIFRYLYAAYCDGGNVEARQQMQRAAYLAGLAFTRAYVGNVHAMAHSLGGRYGTAHGVANAVLLPVVLEEYGKCVHKKLARLAVLCNVAHSSDEASVAAKKFIEAIRALNEKTGIPDAFAEARRADVPFLAAHAAREANPLYPVPQLWDEKKFTQVFLKVIKD